MSDQGESYSGLLIEETHGKGFNNNKPIIFKPVYQLGKTDFVFKVQNPDGPYSKSGWVCAITLNAVGAQFYHIVNNTYVPLETRIHCICDDEIYSHHNPYTLKSGEPVDKNKIVEHFKNTPCTGFFVTSKLISGSVLVSV